MILAVDCAVSSNRSLGVGTSSGSGFSTGESIKVDGSEATELGAVEEELGIVRPEREAAATSVSAGDGRVDIPGNMRETDRMGDMLKGGADGDAATEANK
jgi:hypothetical protein